MNAFLLLILAFVDKEKSDGYSKNNGFKFYAL